MRRPAARMGLEESWETHPLSYQGRPTVQHSNRCLLLHGKLCGGTQQLLVFLLELPGSPAQRSVVLPLLSLSILHQGKVLLCCSPQAPHLDSFTPPRHMSLTLSQLLPAQHNAAGVSDIYLLQHDDPAR